MEKLKPFKNWILLTGLGGVLICGFILFFGNETRGEQQVTVVPEPVREETDPPVKEEKREEKERIMIDIQGSVKRPGVYQMNKGDRIIHAIEKAGGFLEIAEIRSVNQAQKISDEMVIYVAAKGENFTSVYSNDDEESKKININTASASELESLSGVGPSKAASIIAYREANGPFSSFDQLLEVRGIGQKTIEDWKEKIVFQ
jgi:competence protein ComEA